MNLTKFLGLSCTLSVLIILLTFASNATCQQLYPQVLPATPADPTSNLLNSILTPLRSSLQQASNLFGSRMENVYDRISAVQRKSFEMFMRIYNKTYSAEEIPRRMALFFQRRKLIQESISAFREGRLPFRMRENPYIDWDEQELKALTGVSLPEIEEMLPEERQNLLSDSDVPVADTKRPTTRRRRTRSIDDSASMNETMDLDMDDYDIDGNGDDDDDDYDDLDDTELMVKAEKIPATRDWRQSGCVGPVVNQEKCGACYAIATMSVVESMRCLNVETAPTLAPQQIVDCATVSRGYSNYGCDGGWPTRALKYLQDSGVASREACYPFVRRQTSCRLRNVVAKTGCYVSSSPTNTRLNFKVLNNERDILYHVAKTGPVATVMRASDKFLYYGSGIFDDPTCSRRRNDVDHAIVIVGYGRENGQDYWLIKNSWGRSWGVDGYGKYKRGTNACSIGHWGWVLTS